jgi:DNA helicase HerA-like ATPase
MVREGEMPAASQASERRDAAQNDKRILGHVVQCDGARATIAAFADSEDGAVTGMWTVGKMISINLGSIRTVGLVYAINKSLRVWNMDDRNAIEVSVELVGEVRDGEAREGEPPSPPVFDRGITRYPHIGAISHRIRSRDLQAVYDLAGRRGITIGNLSQDDAIDANIAIDDVLSRHFAVVGTTGVGKSTAVGLLLRKTLEARPDLRVLILDPHNEFASALPQYAARIDTGTLDLPFWLFRLEELAEVVFRGREVVPEELDVLRDLIPIAKSNHRAVGASPVLRRGGEGLTADTPIPYRMAELLRLLDERMGLLESKNDRPVYKALRSRIESAINDPRYRFMFGSRMVEDSIHETIGKIFRIPHDGRPVTCFEMAGLPSEVVNSVCSVLARLAFDLALWSDGRLRLLLMCEEAHRYMPSDPRLGFAPTRHALSRIAKEGRKYGCYLGVVTQRPGELDPTILSQCSTIFAMRLANEQDQAIIRSAIADSSASTLSFLSSMGQREAIAFGDGVATTMRLKFERIPQALLPGSGKYHGAAEDPAGQADVDLEMIVDKMRNVQRPSAGLGAEFAEFGLQATEPLVQAGDPGFRRTIPQRGADTGTPDREARPALRPALQPVGEPSNDGEFRSQRLAGFGLRQRS